MGETLRLIADIGGTNARFGLCNRVGEVFDVRILPCVDFPGPAEAAEAYLSAVKPNRRPDRAAFDVACPVVGDRVSLTNRNWDFSIEQVRTTLGLNDLRVINDFAALALALPHLGSNDAERVGGGTPLSGFPMAAIGPGTGLGVSACIPIAGRWVPLACEGGHVTLTAVDDREAAIAVILRRRFGHVSAERALTGPGLVNLYSAICELDGVEPDSSITPAEVTRRGLGGTCATCADALAVFCRLLGTAASNLAMTLDARGGVYIAGGVVPRFIPYFQSSGFRERFEHKGRFSDYVAAMPTYVVTHALPAFVGLAHYVNSD